MHRDEATLLDIVRAARLIQDFVDDLDKEAFIADVKTQSAVLHQLLVLGEATKRLSHEFRAENPDVPWRLMAGMRDILIHSYDTIDLDEVWKSATKDVPELVVKIEPILPTEQE
jgi:uncharacterized protein with HEPN domain